MEEPRVGIVLSEGGDDCIICGERIVNPNEVCGLVISIGGRLFHYGIFHYECLIKFLKVLEEEMKKKVESRDIEVI
mgnify:CR=1 FL=1